MTDGTLAFLALTYSALALFIAIFWVYPAAQRTRVTRKIVNIRDRVEDAVISGELVPDPCVTEFIDRAEILIDDPKMITLTRIWAVHRTHVVHEIPLESEGPDYDSLSPKQRRLMYEFDNEMIDAIAMLITLGSKMAVGIEVAYWVHQGWLKIKGQREGTDRFRALAKEFYFADDPIEWQPTTLGPKGLIPSM